MNLSFTCILNYLQLDVFFRWQWDEIISASQQIKWQNYADCCSIVKKMMTDIGNRWNPSHPLTDLLLVLLKSDFRSPDFLGIKVIMVKSLKYKTSLQISDCIEMTLLGCFNSFQCKCMWRPQTLRVFLL